jgi:hypothetical protein
LGKISKGSLISGVQTKLEPLPFDTSDMLTIVKNELKLRKLLAPKVKGSRTIQKKKQTIKHYKGWFPNTEKIPCMLLCCY